MENKKRYVIGMLVANITDPFSDQAARGAMAAAEQLDCNLIIVPGKYICETSYSNSDTVYEYQYNNLFKYVGGVNLDAVCVCTGTIAYANSYDEKKAFLAGFGSNIPVISVAAKIDGFEHVVFDNTESVRKAVSYLIRKKGAKKIICLSGYDTNSDYRERAEGYRLALADNGLEGEELIYYANPSRACKEDFERVLDEHPDADAVVCSNDDMCVAVYDVCADRGMRVGSDIYVIGFDDMDFAEKLEPPLSSVRASAEDLGYRAVMNAFELLEGREVTKRNVPTRFVPRASCGYVGHRRTDLDMFLNAPHEDRLGRLVYFMYDGTDASKDAYIIKNMKRVVDVIETVEQGGELSRDMVTDVCDAVEKMMDYHKNYFMFLKNLYLVADAIYDKLKTLAMSEESILNLENLYLETYRLLSRDVGVQISRAGEASIDMLRRSNILVRDTLMIRRSGDMAFSDILKRLPLLEINSSYMYLLPKPVTYKAGGKLYDISRWRFVAYSQFEKTASVPASKRDLPLEKLFDNFAMPKDRRFTLVMADLYSGEQQYGILLCELKKQFFEYLEFITYQFGAAVKIISLINELERHMNELHHDNEELEGISRADELTGLLNRRGFYSAAEELVKSKRAANKNAVIVFADLDYLKSINDRYGHNEGDFALKASAELLKKIFRSSDVIGRTGGDEFNILALVGDDPDIEGKIIERKKQFVSQLNSDSGKPYRIDLSMGICKFKCSEITDLSSVIEQADSKLYEVKRHREYNDPYKE